MSTLNVAPLEADVVQIKKSLLADTRFSADALAVLCWTLSIAWERPFSIAELSATWNSGRIKDKHIGVDRMRRLVNEWRKAGYLGEEIETDDTGKITGKKFTIFQSTPAANPLNVTIPLTDATGKAKPIRPHKYPAAEIFQNHFVVDLSLDAMQHIEKAVAGDYTLWGTVCADHHSSLTRQQADSLTYKTKAVKFCLEDFRSRSERAAMRATKTPYKDPTKADASQKKKTFAEYVETNGYRFESPEYENFRTRFLQKAHEKGNLAAIEQVDEYERLQNSLATLQKRKGVKSE